MRKLLGLLGALGLVVTPSVTVIACGGNATTPVATPQLKRITDIIVNRFLGTHKSPTAVEIMERVKFLNKDLDTSQVEVSKIEIGRSVISVKTNSKVYAQGTAIVYFYDGDASLIDLENALSVTDLGDFNHVPSEQEVLDKIKELNKDLDMSQLMITSIDHKQKTFTISVINQSKVYQQGWVNVSYQLDLRININDVIVTTDLKNFGEVPNAAMVLERILQYNPLLNKDEFTIGSYNNGTVVINVKPGSTVYYEGSIQFVYTMWAIVDISTIIKETNLGNFNTTPTDQEILDRIKETNPGFRTEEVEITKKSDNKVTITVKKDSTFYNQGSIEFSYTVKAMISIDDVIKTKDLKNFGTTPTEKQLLERLASYNPELQMDQLEVVSNANNVLTIRVKVNSTVYNQQTIEFIYTVKEIIDISKIITNSDLGNFDQKPTNGDILDRLKKMNPDIIIDEVEVINNAGGKATIKVKDGSTYYNPGSFDVTYKVGAKTSIGVINRDLRNFEVYPLDWEIPLRIVLLNPNIDLKAVNIVHHLDTLSATMTNKDDYNLYEPFEPITFTYTIRAKVSLKTIITSSELGNFRPDAVNVTNIKFRLASLYKDLKIYELDIEIKAAQKKVVVTATSDSTYYYYPEPIELTYTTLAIVDISNILKNTDLGVLGPDPTDEDILIRIREKNPGFRIDEVEVIRGEDGKITIKVKDGSSYYNPGSIEVSYTTQDPISLEHAFIKLNLRNFNKQPSDQEILDRIKEMNPDFKIDEITVDKNENNVATISVKPGSKYYNPGSIDLTYTVLEQIDMTTLIDTHDLQNFVVEPADSNLIFRITQLNPRLLADGFILTTSENGVAIIETDPTSNLYLPGGKVEFSYVINPKLDIDDIFGNGWIGNFNSEPTQKDIFDRISQLYPEFKVSEITISNLGNNKVTITVGDDSTYYFGQSLELTYDVQPIVDLSTVLINTYLGSFDHEPTDQNILTRLLVGNPNVNILELEVVTIIDGKVTIKVKDGSTYYHPGSFELIYVVDTRIDLLDIIGPNRDLGVFNENEWPTDPEFVERLAKVHPEIDIDEIELIISKPSGKVTFRVKDGSTVYFQLSEPIEFVFVFTSTKPMISEIIINKNLGEFDRNPTSDDILNKLKEMYPALAIGDLEVVTNDGQGKTHIKVTTGSKIYQAGEMDLTFKIVKDLITDLTITDLGFIDTKSSGELTNAKILEQVKLLNPNLDTSQLEVLSSNLPSDINKASAVIGVRSTSTSYKPDSAPITVNFTRRINLNDVLTKIAIEFGIVSDTVKLDWATVKNHFIQANPRLDGSQVTLKVTKWPVIIFAPTGEGTFTVNADSQIYFAGSINVTFKVHVI